MYDVVPLRRFDRIITDDRLQAAAADGIRDLGVELDLAHATTTEDAPAIAVARPGESLHL